MNFYHFPLALSPEQEGELKQDYALFSEVLEKQAIVPPDFLAGLVGRLRGALDGLQLTDYERFRQNSQVPHNLVHFTHDDHAILNLPWQEAIGDAGHLYFSRGATLRGKAELPAFRSASDGPLRILVMVAAPETDGESGRLRYEDEQLQIAEAFGPLLRHGGIEIHFTADGSEQALRQAFDAPRYDIFHFSGHSEYDVHDWMNVHAHEGFLLLEDERSMRPHRFPAANFAALLNERPEKTPALVFLSSCQSAQGASGGGYSGVTGRLLEAGIPGVVAMSHSVVDVYATLFAAQFYKHLAEGLSVPLAFSRALKTSRNGNSDLRFPPEFWQSQSLIPQLYLTQNIGALATTANSGKQRQGKFWQTGRLREKLQKIHRFAGKEDKDFIFIGRRREQKAIRRHLEEAAPVYLQGQGGIGKTALAVHTAERLVLADPDEAQVFMFDENSFRIGQVTDELIAFLQNEQKQILLAHQIKSMDKAWEKFITALQEVFNRSHPVFIFDNLESFQSADGGGDFLPEFGMEWDILKTLAEVGLPLILTGRYPLPELPGLRTVELHEPTRPDFAMKCRYLDISEKIPPGEAGKPVFETLFRSFGGNYRALEYFDQLYREKKEAFGEVLETLDAFIEKHRADPNFPLTRMSENLVFERLLGLLDAPARRALGLLAHFRRPVLPLAVEMQDSAHSGGDSKSPPESRGAPPESRVSPPESREAPPEYALPLTQLSNLTLAEKTTGPDGHAFFYVPTLTRLLLERAGLLAPDFSDQKAGEYYDYVVENVTNLVADLEEAFFHFLQAKDVEKVNKTGERLTDFLYGNSQYQNALLVAGQTYETCGEQTAESLQNRLGQVFHLFGKGDEALTFFEKALSKYRETDNRQGEDMILNNIGDIYRLKGEYDIALQYFNQSLIIQREIKNQMGEGVTLNNISLIYEAKGDYDIALRYLEQSLKIRQQIGDLKGEGATLNNIGLAYRKKGNSEKALKYYEKSLKILQQIGDLQGEGATLNNISHLYSAKHDYDTALRYLEQSLKIRQQIGDRLGEGVTLNNISQFYSVKGDYDTALRYLEQSLKIRQQIGDRKGEGTTLNNISHIYSAKGDHDTALRYLGQSLKIRQQIGDIPGRAATLYNMGTILFKQNRPEEAVPLLWQAYQIFQKIGSPNVRAPVGYLETIIEQIGEARFKEIVAGMQ
ncbi:MAG: tetratricopeptide repeat protein [Saprospiraceae bacterium]